VLGSGDPLPASVVLALGLGQYLLKLAIAVPTPRSSTSSSAPSASSPGAGPLRFVRFDPPIRFSFSCSSVLRVLLDRERPRGRGGQVRGNPLERLAGVAGPVEPLVVHRPHRPVRPPARGDRPVRSLAGRDPRSSSRSKRGPSRTRRRPVLHRRLPGHFPVPDRPPVHPQIGRDASPRLCAAPLPRPRSRAPSPGRRDRPRAPRRTRDRARGRRPATSRRGRRSPRTRRPRPRTPDSARPGGSRARGCPDVSPRVGRPTFPRRPASRPAPRASTPTNHRSGSAGHGSIHRTWWVSGRGGNDHADAEGTSVSPRFARRSRRRPSTDTPARVPFRSRRPRGRAGRRDRGDRLRPGPARTEALGGDALEGPSVVRRAEQPRVERPGEHSGVVDPSSEAWPSPPETTERHSRRRRAVRQPDRDRPRSPGSTIRRPSSSPRRRACPWLPCSTRGSKSLRRTQETYPTPP